MEWLVPILLFAFAIACYVLISFPRIDSYPHRLILQLLLHYEECSGKDLVLRSGGALTSDQVFTKLGDLVDERLVASRDEDVDLPEGMIRRKLFHLTSEGRLMAERIVRGKPS
jgi:hypothetical protein